MFSYKSLSRKQLIFPIIVFLALLFFIIYFSNSIAGQEKTIKQQALGFEKRISDLNKEFSLEQEVSLEKQQELFSKIQTLKAELSILENEQLVQNQHLLDLIKELEAKSSLEFSELKKAVSDVNASADFSKIAANSLPAIVSISTLDSKGSGFFVRSNGLIVSNYHVVKNAQGINISLNDGRSFTAVLAGFDEAADLVVLKIPETSNSFLEFGDSTSLKIGERVIALGSPYGLDFTVTQGIVSSKNRLILGQQYSFLQTDVPLNPGNSGGPLINASGKVVGITTAKILEAESLAFALPSNTAKPVIDRIISGN